MLLASSPGPSPLSAPLWSELVSWLLLALDFVRDWTVNLFRFFMTPIDDLIDRFSPGLSGTILEAIIDFFGSIFGFDPSEVTFIELTLGFMLPFIMIFTIYRYIKQ